MTAVDPTPPNDQQAAAQRRAAARDAYRASVAEGVPLTGAELGRRFGLSPRWGRDRVAEVHAEAARTNGGGAETGDSPDPHARSRDQPRRETGPKDRQADVAERGAESAWRSSNGAAPRSDRRAGSERPPGNEAPTVVRGITTLAVLAVAVVAAVASYDHQRALAELAGEGWRAWLLPVSVDGLVVAASMSILVRRRAGLTAGSLAWTSLLAGIGASLAANVAAADPTAIGRVVAAWPPVALLLAWELLMQVRAPIVAGDRSTVE
ncbi:MAG: DUF2637 domain-containing protein [Acidimicrobiales bacterium]